MNVLLASLLFLISIFLAFYTYYTLRHLSVSRVSLPFALLMVSFVLYACGYGAELLNFRLELIYFWSAVQYTGLSVMPYLWLWFTSRYVGMRWLDKPGTRAAFLAASAVTLFGAYTDPWLHLKYATATVGAEPGFPVLEFSWGPLYYFHVAYSFLAYFTGTGLLAFFVFSTGKIVRRNLALMIAGSAVPWLHYVLYLFGVRFPGIDTTPFSMFFAVLFFGIAIFSARLLDADPVTRSAAFEIISDAVVVLDGFDRVADCNRAARTLFPSLETARDDASLREALSKAQTDVFETVIETGGEKRIFDCRITRIAGEETREARSCDGVSPANAAVLPSPKNLRQPLLPGKIVLFKDITEASRLLEKVKEMAAVDFLTGLYNRRHFFDQAERIAERLRTGRRPLAFVIVDLDLFKVLNDTYGHPAGDEIIKAAARAISESVRPTDLAARFGGEEFVCLLPETDITDAQRVAERIRRKIESLELALPGLTTLRAGTVTASLGVSGVAEVTEGFSLDRLISEADRALYEAKRDGRNRFRIA